MQDNTPPGSPFGKKTGPGKYFNKAGSRGRHLSLTEELLEVEQELVTVLERRIWLLSKAAGARYGKGRSLADPNQERKLRRIWDDMAGKYGLDIRLLREIFTLANGLAYSRTVKPEAASRRFSMFPELAGVALTLPGPRCRLCACLLVVLMAESGAEAELGPVLVSDQMTGLINALNRAGMALERGQEKVTGNKGKLRFAGRAIHVGNDPLVLYLLLALALPQPGRSTYTGESALKLLPTEEIRKAFARLGARLTPIEPHIPGVPLRLESAGIHAEDERTPVLHLEPTFPLECALALALAAPTYPKGLHLTFEPGFAADEFLLVQKLLGLCQVEAALSATSFIVPAGPLQFPQDIPALALPLDIELSGFLLALPRVTGGSVTLTGLWPDNEAAQAVVQVLQDSGLGVDKKEDSITTSAGNWPENINFTADRSTFPLAAALAIAAPQDARIEVEDGVDTATVEELAGRVGSFARVRPGRVVIVKGSEPLQWKDKAKPFVSPLPVWSLALMLLSTVAPGATLANPGGLSEVWPGFWGMFAGNFQSTQTKGEQESGDSTKKGRRVRLS